jgi:TPR repeat protein
LFALVVGPVLAELPPTALEALRQRAEAGENDARFELGRALLRGEDMPRNLTEAFRFLQPAAEAGHAEAMGAFGFMLARGLGAPADEIAGFHWITKAADAGVLSAQLNQGIMTLRGQGTARDPDRGLTLITQAAERGSVEAQARLAEAYFLGETGLVPKSAEAAAPWALKAADAGNAWSQNLVGTMKEHGQGLARDPQGAVEFYRRAARQGDPKAQSSLGRLLHASSGPGDRIEAYYWLRSSAEQGEITARNFFVEVESGFTPDEREAGENRLRESPPPKASGPRSRGPGPPIPRDPPVPRPSRP